MDWFIHQIKIKFLFWILLSLACFAFSNTNTSGNKRAVETNENQDINSKLSLIDTSFKKGDMKTAPDYNSHCQIE